ncbi:hypothetical protein HDU96_002354, partial [Phlyctochytrium bullatum]
MPLQPSAKQPKASKAKAGPASSTDDGGGETPAAKKGGHMKPAHRAAWLAWMQYDDNYKKILGSQAHDKSQKFEAGKVPSKISAFGDLAKYINREVPGTDWDAQSVSNRWSTWYDKYKKVAKMHASTGDGVEEEDGGSLSEKYEKQCPGYWVLRAMIKVRHDVTPGAIREAPMPSVTTVSDGLQTEGGEATATAITDDAEASNASTALVNPLGTAADQDINAGVDSNEPNLANPAVMSVDEMLDAFDDSRPDSDADDEGGHDPKTSPESRPGFEGVGKSAANNKSAPAPPVSKGKRKAEKDIFTDGRKKQLNKILFDGLPTMDADDWGSSGSPTPLFSKPTKNLQKDFAQDFSKGQQSRLALEEERLDYEKKKHETDITIKNKEIAIKEEELRVNQQLKEREIATLERNLEEKKRQVDFEIERHAEEMEIRRTEAAARKAEAAAKQAE